MCVLGRPFKHNGIDYVQFVHEKWDILSKTQAAERLALQRRAVESERAVGTNSVSKMRMISLSEARPLQAPVGRPSERIAHTRGLN